MIIDWVTKKLLTMSIKPSFLIEGMGRCRNPLGHFNLETDWRKVDDEIDEEVKRMEYGN